MFRERNVIILSRLLRASQIQGWCFMKCVLHFIWLVRAALCKHLKKSWAKLVEKQRTYHCFPQPAPARSTFHFCRDLTSSLLIFNSTRNCSPLSVSQPQSQSFSLFKIGSLLYCRNTRASLPTQTHFVSYMLLSFYRDYRAPLKFKGDALWNVYRTLFG